MRTPQSSYMESNMNWNYFSLPDYAAIQLISNERYYSKKEEIETSQGAATTSNRQLFEKMQINCMEYQFIANNELARK